MDIFDLLYNTDTDTMYTTKVILQNNNAISPTFQQCDNHNGGYGKCLTSGLTAILTSNSNNGLDNSLELDGKCLKLGLIAILTSNSNDGLDNSLELVLLINFHSSTTYLTVVNLNFLSSSTNKTVLKSNF